jgi:hypothetical protein
MLVAGLVAAIKALVKVVQAVAEPLVLLGLPILGVVEAVIVKNPAIFQAAQVDQVLLFFVTPAQFNISLVAQ